MSGDHATDFIKTQDYGPAFGDGTGRVELNSLSATTCPQNNPSRCDYAPWNDQGSSSDLIQAAQLPQVRLIGASDASNPVLYHGELIAFNLSSHERLSVEKFKHNDTNPQTGPVSGAELVKIAEKLGHDPRRWAQTKESPMPKCNQYVEAVLQAARVPFPWKPRQSDCHAMRAALDAESQKPDSMWKKVYAYDKAHGVESDRRFTLYEPKDGDVIIWDGWWGKKWHQHSGIASEPYDLLWAGSASASGWARANISDFTLTPGYGSPTAVYRCKVLR